MVTDFWRNAEAPLTLKIVTASCFPQDVGFYLQADTASQPKRLQFEVVIGIQYAKVLYSKTSSLAMRGQHTSRFCIYLQIIMQNNVKVNICKNSNIKHSVN
jgi:hypothetical protein